MGSEKSVLNHLKDIGLVKTAKKVKQFNEKKKIEKLGIPSEDLKTILEIWREEKLNGMRFFFTIGYANIKIRDFLDILLSVGIELVIDTRYYPKAHSEAYSRANLREILNRAEIEYLWIKKLTNQHFSSKDYLRKFRAYFEIQGEQLLGNFHTYINQFRVCLLGSKKYSRDCERGIISETIIKKWSRFKVKHLGEDS